MSRKYNKNKSLLTLFISLILSIGVFSCGSQSSSDNNVKNPKNSLSSIKIIEIAPLLRSISVGNKIQLFATSFDAQGKKQDVTNDVEWKSSDENIFKVSKQGELISLAAGTGKIIATINAISSTLDILVNNAPLVAIEISPHQKNIVAGASINLTATGIYSNNFKLDITKFVTWTSEDATIIHVNNQVENIGEATGLRTGSTKVIAALDNIESSEIFTVTDASLIEIIIKNLSTNVIQGTKLSLEAVGVYSDGTNQTLTDQVIWKSSNPEIAAISNNESNAGLLNSIGVGSSEISATYKNISVNEKITVNNAVLTELTLDSNLTSIAIGNTIQIRATGILSNGTTQDMTELVNWRSDSLDVLSVNNDKNKKGYFNALNAGTANISASLNSISSTTSITVSNAVLTSIEISNQNVKIANNSILKLKAIGIYNDGTHRDITEETLWQSDNLQVIFVSNATDTTGIAYSFFEGVAIVTATKDDVSGATTITVNEKTLNAISIQSNNTGTIAAGYSAQLTAIGNYSDGSTQDLSGQVTWQSSNSTICKITTSENNTGLLQGKKKGICNITARMRNTSRSQIFEISDAQLSSIVISPNTITIAKGTQAQLVAVGTYSDNSKLNITNQVSWKSTSGNISNNGLLTASEVGTNEITASYNNISDTSSVIVSTAILESISISPLVENDFISGTKKLFIAIGTYSDQSTQNISKNVLWQSSDNTIASVSNAENDAGQVASFSAGNASLSAVFSNISSNMIMLNIIEDPIAPISLSQTATPFIILNNDTDTSTIEINVQASSIDQRVLDNTEIELEIINGNGTLSADRVYTINGKAAFSLTSASKGLITIKTKIANTELENTISVYATDNFSNTIARYGFAKGKLENDLVLTDSQFGMLLFNFSNRAFSIDGYRVFNENNVVVETDDSSILNNNSLAAGEFVNVIYKTTQAMSNNYVVVFYLSEPVTGQQFVIVGGFKLKAAIPKAL